MASYNNTRNCPRCKMGVTPEREDTCYWCGLDFFQAGLKQVSVKEDCGVFSGWVYTIHPYSNVHGYTCLAKVTDTHKSYRQEYDTVSIAPESLRRRMRKEFPGIKEVLK